MNKKGFTLIELLVVVAIIGLLSTLAVVALGSARQKANDAKRVSDIKQMQTALELYYTDNNGYPAALTAQNLGTGSYACLNTSGFAATGCSSPYMGLVPRGPGSAEYYRYTSTASSTYIITGVLESGAGGFRAGTVTATPSGITGQ